MPNHPPTNPTEVVLLDNSPPRRQASSSSPSNEVIVLDQSPPLNTGTNTNNHPQPIVVEEHPPKRRRRDHPTTLPLHQHTTSPSQNSPPVIVVEDDDDSSDPDSPPASTNPTPFTPVTQVAPPRTIRLPRINTPQNVRVQDDIIEMSATGPTINRNNPSSAAPVVPPICPPSQSTRTRHTSMPRLFSFTQRSAAGPQATPIAPPSTSRNIPRPILRQVPISVPRSSNTTTNPNASPHVLFPHPLPEQSLPPTGRGSVRTARQVRFSQAVGGAESLNAGATATLSVLRNLERRGLHGTGPPTGLHRHVGEPFIQVVNGPSVYFDIPQNSAQNPVPQSTTTNHLRQPPIDPHHQAPYSRPNLNMRRRQGPSIRRAPAAGTANPAPSRSGSHRSTRLGAHGMSRAHMQQLNALHSTATGTPFREEGVSFLPPGNPSVANSSLSSAHRMIVAADLREAATTSHTLAETADAAAAVAVGAAVSAMVGLPTAGLTVTASQAPIAYGQGSSFTVSSSAGAPSNRHRNPLRQPPGQRQAPNQHRQNQGMRRLQRYFRISGTGVTTGIEIQYLHGVHGDRALDYEQLIRLDEQLIREKNRADKDQIDSLPISIATAEDKEIRCCVCMCDVEEGEELRVLPCSHKYHKKCIDEWLTYNGCCPVDKKRIGPRVSRAPFSES